MGQNNNTLNTNNSLSDLNNAGYQFNTMLNDADINSAQKNNQQTANTNNQQTATALQTKQQSAANDTEKTDIQTGVANKTNLTQNNTTQSDPFGGVQSLFDRSAMIDYARYVLPNGNIFANWIEYKHFTPNDPTTPFVVNNTAPINEPVSYKDSSLFPSTSINPNFSNEGLSLNNLISWSEKYPSLQLRYQDFVYCKKLGYFPNNRLIILRRFKGGVPDNLFDYYNTSTSKVQYTQPLATMITWLEPNEEIMEMSFNEVWEDHHDSFLNVLKNSKEKMIPKPAKKGSGSGNESDAGLSNTFEDLATALTLQGLLKNNKDLIKENGVPYTRSDIGNPNLVTEASKRKTNGEGLESEIRFTLKFEYEMRYINKIDPGIAMLDLLANAMRMGTSESEFRYNIPFLKNNDTLKALINGDIAKFTQTFTVNIQNLTKSLSNTLSSFITNNTSITTLSNTSTNDVATAIKAVATDALAYIISRYREDLKAALAADTGLPSGIFHLTVGNPKSPFISCGDLIISNSKLKLGKELGYNDFPNSFEVEYDLRSSRTRGRQEISRIFNAGRGRLYVYPNAKNNPDFDLY